MSRTTLLRYNFRILLSQNGWLLVFPVAVSQLTVFWNVLTQRFSPGLPAWGAEMVTPLLAAFLGAHLLAAEYRSRIGAVLASRPVNIGRIVALRLAVLLALVWGLAALSLYAYSVWMQPYLVRPVALACIPSTLFLTLLAITFATLFRNPLAGFGVAALYWSLDLAPGAPLHPYLSLRSLTSHYAAIDNPDRQSFVQDWWVAKVVLFVLALLLYLFHARLVFGLGSQLTLRTRRRAVAGAVGLLAFTLVSGAALRVGYGYTNRGRLLPNDLAWFRYQFASYGPIPAPALFGTAFRRYLGDIGSTWRLSSDDEADRMGDTPAHRRDLKALLAETPDSLWAPGAAEALARIEANRQGSPEAVAAYYQSVADRYPQSPYAAYSARQAARTLAEAGRDAEAFAAFAKLLDRFPGGLYGAEAARYVVAAEMKAGRPAEAVRRAQAWAEASGVSDRFEAFSALAGARRAGGDLDGARQAAQQALDAAEEFRRALGVGKVSASARQMDVLEESARQAETILKAPR